MVAAPAGPAGYALRASWQEPGTRLGLATHFVTPFSGNMFALFWGYPYLVQGQGLSPAAAGALLTVLVVAGMGIGPLLGALAGRWPLRRSVLVLGVVLGSAAGLGVVLLWPGQAPVWLLALLVLVLAGNGPGSILGFDFARTENPPARLGSATGIVNVGGFVATLLMILVVGLLLDASGSYRVAMSAQYAFWAVGAGRSCWRPGGRCGGGATSWLDPFPRAVVRAGWPRARLTVG